MQKAISTIPAVLPPKLNPRKDIDPNEKKVRDMAKFGPSGDVEGVGLKFIPSYEQMKETTHKKNLDRREKLNSPRV